MAQASPRTAAGSRGPSVRLVRVQPAVLGLSVQEQLEPNMSWLQDRLALDQEGLQRAVRRLTPAHGLAELLGSNMEETL